MPLSDHEQHLLEQIERGLYADDPRLASTVRSTDLRTHYRRRLRIAIFGFLAGMITLLAGAVSTNVAVAVVGFVLMLIAALRAIGSIRGLTGHAQAASPGAKRQPRGARGTKGSLGSRAEERFRRRFDGDPDA